MVGPAKVRGGRDFETRQELICARMDLCVGRIRQRDTSKTVTFRAGSSAASAIPRLWLRTTAAVHVWNERLVLKWLARFRRRIIREEPVGYFRAVVRESVGGKHGVGHDFAGENCVADLHWHVRHASARGQGERLRGAGGRRRLHNDDRGQCVQTAVEKENLTQLRSRCTER